VDFVATHNGELPNKNNTTPLDGPIYTVHEAAEAGVDTTCDAEALLQEGYFPTPT